MSPGSFNGHNHGGGHTGDGKKQKTGIYNLGYHNLRQSNKYFKVGIPVYNIKTGEKGIIGEKKLYKNKRSIVYFNGDKHNYYILTNMLRTLNNPREQIEKKLTTLKKNKASHSKGDRECEIYESQTFKKEFREKRKMINDILRKHCKGNELSLCGSTNNLTNWVSNRQDFYDFVNKHDENSIQELFKRDTIFKKFVIDSIVDNYIEKLPVKSDLSEENKKLRIDNHREEYKNELKHKTVQELKKMCVCDISDFELIDKEPIELDFEIV